MARGAIVQSVHVQLGAEVDEHGDSTGRWLRVHCVHEGRLRNGAQAVSEASCLLICLKATLCASWVEIASIKARERERRLATCNNDTVMK